MKIKSILMGAGMLVATSLLVGNSFGFTGGKALAGDKKVASAKSKQDTQDPPVPLDEHYTLGPEDVLTIITQNIPEDSGDFLVRPDGHISFPIVGDILVAGQTVKEVEATLTKGLAKELRHPQVSVNIKQMRLNRIYIDGSVRAPSSYDYKKGWRLSELISVAGGMTDQPQRLTALIYRTGETTQKIDLRKVYEDVDDNSDVAVMPGDSIYIRAEPTMHVNVIGQVQKSGVTEIYEGQGAVQALGAAQGATAAAALTRAKIIRHGQEIPVDLYDAVVNADNTKNIEMQPDDTLLIPQQLAQVSVVGTVARPGPLQIQDGRPMTLSQAISEAGGLAPRAKPDATLTTIGKDGKLITEKFNLKNLGTPGHPDVVLKDKDVVFVPQSGATNIGDLSNVGQFYYIVRSIFRGY